ncbi:MAG: iron-containing alcohol dehydrogenase [Firmicutes bacterium]|nr:iron-containing alcohol dehydrogenase [Bacillota bacterium]
MLNIGAVEFGSGVLQKLPDLMGSKAFVLTQSDPWNAVCAQVAQPLTPGQIVHVTSVYERDLDAWAQSAQPYDTIFGVGGGMAIDAAKYVSWKTGKALIQVPTIISTDAFATEAIGVRSSDNRVRYVGHAEVQRLIVDFNLFRSSPRGLTTAGAGDILSCHTACRDWEIAVADGVSEHPINTAAIRRARKLVDRIAEYAGEIYGLTDLGLKVLLDCHLEIVEICQPLGHFRAEEGSEHFLFYKIENLLRRPFVHGQIVGLGIVLMSGLQGNREQDMVELMRDLGIEWQPKDLEIPREVMFEALSGLAAFVREEGLWHSVIDRGISAAQAKTMVAQLLY